ncbi:MAG: MATE family efflux transporter [Lachnospiraceae bacterium]|nr:MATE family efflux transporter [Lachnospiraceae bacterium]
MFTKDPTFHKSFWNLFLFLVLQNVILLGVNLLDNIMLGAYSENALAGAAAVNQIQFLLNQVFGGLGNGMVVIASQYWGKKDIRPIKPLAGCALVSCLVAGAAVFVLVGLFPAGALRLFTDDAAIAAEGMRYLAVVKYTYGILAVTMTLYAMLRSVEIVRVAVALSAVAVAVNVFGNYLLIYGHMGFPAMGAAGAAWATLASRAVELVCLVCYLAFGEKRLSRGGTPVFSVSLWGDYWRVSLPLVIIGFMWGMSTGLQTVILGHMSAGAIAANSIAVNFVMVLKVLATSAAVAASVVVGKAVGEGDIPKVKEYSRTLQLIFLCIGAFIFANVFIWRGALLSFYHISETTKDMAGQFLGVLAVTSFGMAYQMPALGGIVQGGGDTKFVMYNDLISVWGIVLPLSFAAAFRFGWPPVAVLACLHSDQVFKCIPAVIKVNRYRWIKTLTR